ncbi:MAG: sulfite exporter TauE/SafE family protein [Defluviicoccus sp.]|nr:sulfite exporter TauE/SafE family protein [Defluviicoccus sp.]MDE0383418.1 sulfite exporter TauE/SafE family protein [Defluviicoccus sp.]
MSIESLAVVIAALLLGTLGKAITGFGLPLFAVPAMAAFIDVQTAVVVMVLPSTLSNAWLIWTYRRSAAAIPGLWTGLACGVAGIGIGAWLLSALDAAVMALVLSGWIAVYLLTELARYEIPPRLTGSRGMLASVIGLAGICQGATGIAGPILVTFMYAMRQSREIVVFGLAAVFLSYGVIQAGFYLSLGLVSEERLWQSAAATIPVVLGMPVGLWIARRIEGRVFRYLVRVLLLAAGVKLFADGLGALA